MKKHFFTFLLTVVCIYAFYLINAKDPKELNHVLATIIVVFIYLVVVVIYYFLIYSKESDEHPYRLDPYLSIVKVKDVKKTKIALVPWGYTEKGLGDIEDFYTYYFIVEIPKELRKKGEIFKISRDEKFNVIFKKIKQEKNSFEVLEDKIYKV